MQAQMNCEILWEVVNKGQVQKHNLFKLSLHARLTTGFDETCT